MINISRIMLFGFQVTPYTCTIRHIMNFTETVVVLNSVFFSYAKCYGHDVAVILRL